LRTSEAAAGRCRWFRMATVLEFEHFPGRKLHVLLFRGVKNAG